MAHPSPATGSAVDQSHIGFVTDDVDAAYKKAIAAGAIEVAPPESKPWGQTVSYVREINGFLVGINSPMGG